MRTTIVAVISAVLLSVLPTQVQCAEVAKMAIGDWAPYTSKTDVDGKLAERIVAEAFKMEGVEVEYKYYPWKRSYQMTKDGEADGTFPWNRTEERERDCHYSAEPIVIDDGVYFHLASTKFEWSSLEDLKKWRVGVSLGFKQEKLYKDNGINAEVASDEESNFRKILAGRIDIYETSKVVGYATIAKLFDRDDRKKFTNHPKAAETNAFFVLFSKTSPNGKRMNDLFDSGLQKIKSNGQYDAIINEFFGK